MVDEKREVRQTIIYKAGDPPPWLKSERELVEMGVLPGPAPGSAPEALPSVPAKFEELTNVPVAKRPGRWRAENDPRRSAESRRVV